MILRDVALSLNSEFFTYESLIVAMDLEMFLTVLKVKIWNN